MPNRHSNGRSWRAHIEGMNGLLLLRGPHKHWSDSTRISFSGIRMAEFAYCFSSRKASAFQAPEWSTLPWMNKEKTVKERLYDILMPLPGLLEVVEKLDETCSYEAHHQLRSDLLKYYIELQTWEESLRLQLASDATSYSDSEEFNSKSFDAFGMDVAHSLTTCWAVFIVLCDTLIDLEATQPDIDTAISSTNRMMEILDPEVYIRRITSCLDYFFQPEVGFGGFQIACLPIGTLLAHYARPASHSTEELHKLIGRLCDASRSGVLGPIIGDFLKQLRDARWNESWSGRSVVEIDH
jgi:hypothetical protein